MEDELYTSSAGVVKPDWIDFNGHMTIARYLDAFTEGVVSFYDYLGVGEAYRREMGYSLFALENHSSYQRELLEGDPISMSSQLLAFDKNKMRYFSRLYHAGKQEQAAAVEMFVINVDLTHRRAVDFPPAVLERLQAVLISHSKRPFPVEAGRAIALGKPHKD